MKKVIIALVLLAIIIVVATYYVTYPTTPVTPVVVPADITSLAPDSIISIKNFTFEPATAKIKIGTKLTWRNDDNVSHTINSDQGDILNSQTLAPGESFSFTFTAPGTYNYHCNLHRMMKGKIIVSE